MAYSPEIQALIDQLLTPQIQSLISRQAIFLVNHSGGKDSQAMILALRAIIPVEQLAIVHAELPGVDWPGLREHIEKYNADLPIHYCHARNAAGELKTFESEVRRKRMFPAPKQRWCTSDLKRTPIEVVTRSLINDKTGRRLIVNCEGIRAQESDERRKKNPFELLTDKGHTAAGREWYSWFPVFSWSEAQVRRAISEAGQELHWAYGPGGVGGMERLSCCFCIYGRPRHQLTAIKMGASETGRRLAALEREINFSLSMPDESGKRVWLDELPGLAPEPKKLSLEERLAAVRELAAAQKKRQEGKRAA